MSGRLKARSVARALAAAAAVAALASLGGSAPALGGGPATQAQDPPSRLLVSAREFSLTLSRKKLAAGQSIVQLYDDGEDPHDLVLQRVGSNRTFEVGDVEPGETAELRLKLRRGSRYRLWCSLPRHAELGMFAALRTARR